MTGNASAGAKGDDEAAPGEYDEMLAAVDAAITEARQKVESGRVYDAENEKVRIKWIRALAYAVNVRRQVTVDRDLEELSERVERLEQDRAPGAGVDGDDDGDTDTSTMGVDART